MQATFQSVIRISLPKQNGSTGAVLNRFQGKRFVFTIQAGGEIYKIFQVAFLPKDGTIISTPYLQRSEGILSLVRMPFGFQKADVELANSGKVTSHLVKYTHHPDGGAHFSQDGKVFTRIRNKSFPLKQSNNHLFAIRAQGLGQFKQADPKKDTIEPKLERTVLNFVFTDSMASSFKFVVQWFKASDVITRFRSSTQKFEFGASGLFATSDGERMPGYVIGPPQGAPFDDCCLLICCNPIPLLDTNRENVYSFLGGIGTPVNDGETDSEISFLMALYPCANFEELRERVGSIDLSNPSYTT